MDMENAKENLIKFKNNLKEDIKIFEISAINEEGLDKVLLYIADLLDKKLLKMTLKMIYMKIMYYIHLKRKIHLQ